MRNNTNLNELQKDEPFEYKIDIDSFNPEQGMESMRFPHQIYFREDYKG